MDNLIIARPGHKQKPALKITGPFEVYNNLGYPWATVFALQTVKYNHYREKLNFHGKSEMKTLG